LPSRYYEDRTYRSFSKEVITGTRIMLKLGMPYKTALQALMRLVLARKDACKNSGKYIVLGGVVVENIRYC